MNIQSTLRSQRGFTLIELLVVISIIAVLAAAGFAVGTSALERARKLSSQNTATALDQAINMFFSEYGAFPTLGDDDEITTDGTRGAEMLNILLGKELEGGAVSPNTRNLSFFAAKEGSRKGTGGTDGILYDATGNATGLFDSWGNPFTVVMDLDYEEFLEFSPAGLSQQRLNGRRVAVFSPGVRSGETVRLDKLVKTW